MKRIRSSSTLGNALFIAFDPGDVSTGRVPSFFPFRTLPGPASATGAATVVPESATGSLLALGLAPVAAGRRPAR